MRPAFLFFQFPDLRISPEQQAHGDAHGGFVRLGRCQRRKGSYLRFEGSATVERIENGAIVESATEDSALWELMYFGKAGADKKA